MATMLKVVHGQNIVMMTTMSAAQNVKKTEITIISIFDVFDWSIVLFCCFYKCYNAFLKTIECHICDERIRIRDWKNKSSSNGHRKHCSENNKEFLKSLPEPFDVRCPTCFNYLKLLPKVNPMNQISIKHYFSNLINGFQPLHLFISSYMTFRNAGKHSDVMISAAHFPKKPNRTAQVKLDLSRRALEIME